ncbi:MAG: T9SS type A sorting domain-containing protein [Bacteroidia bacterium]|nr:T9SS type A sorting domain-containing protein [Bacteroidia bacterium]
MMRNPIRAFALSLFAFIPLHVFALSNSDVTISRVTAPNFTLDHNKPCDEGPSASYIGIKVTNVSGGNLKDVKVYLQTVTSTSSRAISLSDSTRIIGKLADNQSKTAYYYIKYPCTDGTSVSFSVIVSDDQSGTVSFNTTVTSKDMISASAGGQVDSRTTDTSATIGGLVSDTITYSFGNIKVGDELEFQPTGDSLFNPNNLVLLNCKIISSDIPDNVPVGTEDKMYFVASKRYNGTNHKVKVIFYFVNKMISGSATLSPFASMTSGNSLKYSGNFGTGIAIKAIAPVTNTSPFEVNRSIDQAIASVGDTVVFTVDVINTTSETVMFDQIVETLDTGYAFVQIEPTSEVTSAELTAEPETNDVYSIEFVGGVEETTYPYQTYTIEPADTVTLVYSATVPASSGGSIDTTTTEVMVGGTIGGTDESAGCVGCSALPVHLLSFEARKVENEHRLTWKTASEYDNSHFNLLVSTNGIDYHHITQVPGKGYSQSVTDYEYTHSIVTLQKRTFYRLDQIDFNGSKRSYFTKITSNMLESGINVYPNPTHNILTLGPMEDASLNSVVVRSANGRELNVPFNTLDNGETKLDLSALSDGIYIIQIETDAHTYSRRIIKK